MRPTLEKIEQEMKLPFSSLFNFRISEMSIAGTSAILIIVTWTTGIWIKRRCFNSNDHNEFKIIRGLKKVRI